MKPTTKRLTTTGILVAISAVLFAFAIELPFDGELTIAGMVPIIIIGYKYGVKWGLFSAFAFSLVQIAYGATSSNAFAGMYDPDNAAKSVLNIVLMVVLDYFVAFTVLGLSGMYKNKTKNDTKAFALGALTVCALRFLAHFLSGWILWGSYAEWFFTESMTGSFSTGVLNHFSGQMLSVIYSLVYNGIYMVPETIITVVVCIILISVKPLKKLIVEENA